MDYPGWTIVTTHPIDPESGDYCVWCSDAVGPTIAFATDFGSAAFQNTVLDDEGGQHTVHVTAV